MHFLSDKSTLPKRIFLDSHVDQYRSWLYFCITNNCHNNTSSNQVCESAINLPLKTNVNQKCTKEDIASTTIWSLYDKSRLINACYDKKECNEKDYLHGPHTHTLLWLGSIFTYNYCSTCLNIPPPPKERKKNAVPSPPPLISLSTHHNHLDLYVFLSLSLSRYLFVSLSCSLSFSLSLSLSFSLSHTHTHTHPHTHDRDTNTQRYIYCWSRTAIIYHCFDT